MTDRTMDPSLGGDFPAQTIVHSQLHVLEMSATGRRYQLHIGLPGGYHQETAKRYPVVFVTDGYWDFVKMDVARGLLLSDRTVPDFIIVGLGYAGEKKDYIKQRHWELSPVVENEDPVNTGHAAEFLDTLEKQIIPYVDRVLRTEPSHRILAGASLGGLFTLFAMYTKPRLFEGYIAATPAIPLGDEWILSYESRAVEAGRIPKGRLFFSVGSNEWPNLVASVMRYHHRLASRKHPDFEHQYRVLDGHRHHGMQMDSYVRGLMFVFEPLAPENGPLPDPS